MRRKTRDTLAMAGVLLVLVLVLITRFTTEYKRKNDFYQWTADEVSVSGFVYHKEMKNDEYVYYLKSVRMSEKDGESAGMSGLRVMVKSEREIPLFSHVKVSGRVRRFNHATNEGGYDECLYYEGLGILCEIDRAEIEAYTDVKIGDILYRFSDQVNRFYERCLPGEESGVMSAIALGHRGGLDSGVKDILSGAGIIHIIAVSGLHISVVGRGLYRLLKKKLGVGFVWSGLLAFIVVLFYALMCGMSVSCIRAVGMFAIFLVAEVLGRAYDMGRAAILMACLILFYNPFYLFSSGFIFSFGAVAGIVLVATPMTEIMSNIFEDKPFKNIVLKITSTLSITLFTLPIVAYFYYEIPVYSVLLNLIVLPVMGVLLINGLIVGSVFAYAPAGLLMIGKILVYPCHLIIYYIELIADKSALLPGARFICGRPEWWGIVLYYFMLISFVKIMQGPASFRLKGGAGGAFLVSFFILIFSKNIASEYRISFLDVGQGDGIYLTDGQGCDIMIDGGSTSNKQLGKYTILPFLKFNGVREIDYWFVSHCDEDHVSGLKYALGEGYEIKGVYFSENVQRDDGYEKLVSLLDDAGVKAAYLSVGERLVTGKFTLTCVFPDDGAAVAIGVDANAKSMVLRFEDEYGYTGLFVGDMSETAERAMLGGEEKKYLVSEDGYDFLKVAHHGSKYSSTSEFLQMVKPRIAIISYGKNNYGHPAKDTISRLEEIGAKILKTKEMGQINLRMKRKGILLNKQLSYGLCIKKEKA